MRLLAAFFVLWKANVTDELTKLLSDLPDEAMVPVRWLRSQLQRPAIAHDGVGDLSCADVAQALKRTPGCIRGWCQRGEIQGAYRLNGREWRIPRASLRTYLDEQAQQKHTVVASPVNLSNWRRK